MLHIQGHRRARRLELFPKLVVQLKFWSDWYPVSGAVVGPLASNDELLAKANELL